MLLQFKLAAYNNIPENWRQQSACPSRAGSAASWRGLGRVWLPQQWSASRDVAVRKKKISQEIGPVVKSRGGEGFGNVPGGFWTSLGPWGISYGGQSTK